MERDHKLNHGWWLTRLSVLGILLQNYFNHRYRKYIKTLDQEILYNPENSSTINGRIVYLNDYIRIGQGKLTEDKEIGYGINACSLIRTVEMYQ